MGGAHHESRDPIVDLMPLVRRVVAARVFDTQLVDDLVQETLARVMSARSRVEADSLVPYAIVTARNLIASTGQRQQRSHHNAHLLTEAQEADRQPDEEALRKEEASLVRAALDRLSPADREILYAHEVERQDTATLAAGRGSTPGAIAAQLNRTRARLRVEYLIGQHGPDPPTDRCRPVLLALSAGDRRRQREVDVHGHLLGCDYCASVSTPLLERRPAVDEQGEVRVLVAGDADVVIARQKGREIAARAGFSGTELTVIATAISEIARNIVKFASRGEFVYSVVSEDRRTGLQMVARDRGPGIPDLQRALQDGYSTYKGLGLGLPGTRRLMDEFEIVTEIGNGTMVTMTKWR